MTTFTVCIVLIASLVAGSLLFWTLRLGIGPVPTSPTVRKTISSILPDLVSGDVVELGCGWGQLLTALEKKYTTHSLVAYERSPIPALFSQIFYSAKIVKQDFFRADLKHSGLIVCYLFPGAMIRIENEIIPKLPSGCWIITHTFSLRSRQPVKVIKSKDLYRTPVYLYQI